jgi:NAD(P)-dependent dehydrogenase (short-subunit alcohol dehydrogenase family)
MLDRFSMDGKVTIVTGGGTGLGRAMVRALARAGSDIVVAARRTGPIEETAEEVRDMGRRSLAIPTDVTRSDQVNGMVRQCLQEFGRVDVLINNAAQLGAPRTPIWDMTDDEWRSGIDANLTSAFYCSRAVARPMVSQGNGKIINVSSGYGIRGGRNMYTYTCGKGGMMQLTRTLALSLGPHGVTANTICPGFIPTRGAEALVGSLPRFSDRVPTGEFPKPADIGPIAVFLASAASDYMNGEHVTIDSGGLAGGYAPTGYAPSIPLD